jgi:murein hydrolase activator
LPTTHIIVKGDIMHMQRTNFPISLLIALSLAAVAAMRVSAASEPEAALVVAKQRAAAAEARSETLRQEASSADQAVERLVAQRAMLSAEIDAANAQISAAQARMQIIASRQKQQQAIIAAASAPMLRLNAALQQMTNQPTSLMLIQPGARSDYVHLRAVMATVRPEIDRRTAAMRQQIARLRELRAQEILAVKTLNSAKIRLADRQTRLAAVEADSRGRAGDLSADAAFEFEQAIAQGERARDIVEDIDNRRISGDRANDLAVLDGPILRAGNANPVTGGSKVYELPKNSNLLYGFSELSQTGYRERGVRLALGPNAQMVAPANGKVIYAGKYRSYGQIVIIDHGKGWSTLVTDLAILSVAKGGAVTKGAPIGRVGGETGYVGVELRRNGRPIDMTALLF